MNYCVVYPPKIKHNVIIPFGFHSQNRATWQIVTFFLEPVQGLILKQQLIEF